LLLSECPDGAMQ